MTAPFRVIISAVDTAAGRGVGRTVAFIEDAKDIGVAEQANGTGEFFMTLPIDHPQASAIEPLQVHYHVQRWDGSAYASIARGIVDDYSANADEVVFYGIDYLGLLSGTITAANTSYTNTAVGTIISQQLTAARSFANSRVNFIGMGTIEATSTTTTVISAFQDRLQFISQLADILMSDRSVRSIIQVSPRSSDSPSFNFTENQGQDRENIRLEYGGLVNDFLYEPGYGSLVTSVNAVGQKREGASILYSSQSYADRTVYGLIQGAAFFLDVVNQTALDGMAKREARRRGRVGKVVGLGLRVAQFAPWDGFDLGDSLRVIIRRGIVNVNALYTLWGLEWIGKIDGSEELTLSLAPKDT